MRHQITKEKQQHKTQFRTTVTAVGEKKKRLSERRGQTCRLKSLFIPTSPTLSPSFRAFLKIIIRSKPQKTMNKNNPTHHIHTTFFERQFQLMASKEPIRASRDPWRLRASFRPFQGNTRSASHATAPFCMQRKRGGFMALLFYANAGGKGSTCSQSFSMFFFFGNSACVFGYFDLRRAVLPRAAHHTHTQHPSSQTIDLPPKVNPQHAQRILNPIQNFDQQSHAKYRQNNNNQTNNDENRTHEHGR